MSDARTIAFIHGYMTPPNFQDKQAAFEDLKFQGWRQPGGVASAATGGAAGAGLGALVGGRGGAMFGGILGAILGYIANAYGIGIDDALLKLREHFSGAKPDPALAKVPPQLQEAAVKQLDTAFAPKYAGPGQPKTPAQTQADVLTRLRTSTSEPAAPVQPQPARIDAPDTAAGNRRKLLARAGAYAGTPGSKGVPAMRLDAPISDTQRIAAKANHLRGLALNSTAPVAGAVPKQPTSIGY